MTEDNKDLHSVKNLKGVGPKISESLKSLGIFSVQDAMFHLPFRYEDRTVLTPIGEASYEKSVLIEGEIVKSTVVFRGCLLYTSPSPRDVEESRMPSSA